MASLGNVHSTDGGVGDLDIESEQDFNLNSDSGVQNVHSSSVTSTSMESSLNSSESLNSAHLSDELLFSKQHLTESSTDTQDVDGPPAVSHYGEAPTANVTNELA